MKEKFTSIFLLFIFVVNAQKHELGKVTIAELSQKNHQKESTAGAAILYNKGKTYFEYTQKDGFTTITDVETKIKIYSKEAYNWANLSINLYNSDNGREIVEFSNAITYNLVNGAIEKTKLKTENQFYEVKDKNWSKSKISMPNVKEGSIIKYKYTIKSPFFTDLPLWYFQKTIPVDYSNYEIAVPEFYFYNPHLKGFLTPIVTRIKKNKTINYSGHRTNSTGVRNGYDQQLVSGSFDYEENSTNYLLENIPSLKDENYVNNIANYTSSIEHELSGYQLPEQTFNPYATTWEAVAKKIYENEKFGNELDKRDYFETEITPLIKNLKTDNELITNIFKYVQKRMSWNEVEKYFCEDGVVEAFKSKTGNAAEINLMLISMLRFAGLKAYPIIISTRDNGINLFPSRTAFNYVIAGVEIGEKTILLDATDKFSTVDVMPFRNLNWSGRLIKKDGSSTEIDLMPNFISKSSTFVFANISSNGLITGKQRNQYSDYFAFGFRKKYDSFSKDKYLEELDGNYKAIDIENYDKLGNIENEDPVTETFTFSTNNFIENLDNKLYFSPLLYLPNPYNPFTEETREYPIDFNFPKEEKINLNITIPDDYEVESLPEQSSLKMEGNYASFLMQVVVKENHIQVQIIKTINTSIISAEEYPNLKNYYKMMIEKESRKIILRRKM